MREREEIGTETEREGEQERGGTEIQTHTGTLTHSVASQPLKVGRRLGSVGASVCVRSGGQTRSQAIRQWDGMGVVYIIEQIDGYGVAGGRV